VVYLDFLQRSGQVVCTAKKKEMAWILRLGRQFVGGMAVTGDHLGQRIGA
jgi:hypothetical protein